MIFIANEKQCLTFLRIKDKESSETGQRELTNLAVPTGKIVVHRNLLNNQRDFKKNLFDIYLRYEQVYLELDNIFAEFTDQTCKKDEAYLYVCGYLDNSIKIFNLNRKEGKHLVY